MGFSISWVLFHGRGPHQWDRMAGIIHTLLHGEA
jgi:hypothetical protein